VFLDYDAAASDWCVGGSALLKWIRRAANSSAEWRYYEDAPRNT
jgi:hypothetical protein